MIRRKSRCKKVVSTIFSSALFIGCTIFVIARGQKCFNKYMKEPEAVDVSYKFNGDLIFPSFTIMLKNDWKSDIVEKCQLNMDDYIKTGPWVVSENPNCSDPKLLFEEVGAQFEDLHIEWLRIKTFAMNEQHFREHS